MSDPEIDQTPVQPEQAVDQTPVADAPPADLELGDLAVSTLGEVRAAIADQADQADVAEVPAANARPEGEHEADPEPVSGEPTEPSPTAPAPTDNSEVPESDEAEHVLPSGALTNVPDAGRNVDPATGVL